MFLFGCFSLYLLWSRKFDFFVTFLNFSIVFFNLLYHVDCCCSDEIFVMFERGSCFVLCGELFIRFLLVGWVISSMISVIVDEW